MQAIQYPIKHAYQNTNDSCSQAALAMLLSHYGMEITPEEVAEKVPELQGDKGEACGSINQQLATWCLSLGFDVAMYTFDFQIVDFSWQNRPPEQVLERLEAVKDERNVPALGKEWSKMYTQSYIDFMKAGGVLRILPHVTTTLLYDLLKIGPFLPAVSFSVLHNSGRGRSTGLRESVADDVKGNVTTHSIVVYGADQTGNFLIADPWKEPGLFAVEPERLLCAMTAAQIECDNLLFQISKRPSAPGPEQA